MTANESIEQTDPRRSALMARVRREGTEPELTVRHIAHRMGYRFRLHRKDLPGTPDLVFPKHRVALFVHGCFWHRHIGCPRTTTPKTRTDYWRKKFKDNVERDKKVMEALEESGWRVLIIWECETFKSDVVENKLNYTLG